MTTTVAIVDDHRLFREALADIIRKLDRYELLYVAENGQDLLDQIQTKNQLPDLALVDLHMPVMDGFETTAQLRQRYPSTRVLVVTISDLKEEIEQAFRSGAHGYLVKGAVDELRQAMEAVLTQGHYFPDSLKASFRQDLSASTEHPSVSASPLTDAERVFLTLAASELTYPEMAEKMSIALSTLEAHRESVFTKLQVRTRVEMVIEAIRRGLIQL